MLWRLAAAVLRGRREVSAVRRTVAVAVAAGSVLLGVAAASPALGAGRPADAARAADKLLCSPSANGGNLVKGMCVLPRANVADSYEAFIITSEEDGGTFQIVSGSLPPGLKMPARFGAAGTIVGGTPTMEGTFPFTVTGTDDLGQPLKQAYSITVAPPLRLAIENPSTLPAGQVGASYFPVTFFTTHGAPATVTWSVAAGHLPPGLALSSPNAPDIIHNQLSGTPTKAGTFTFTMKVTDGIGRHVTKRFDLTIQP